MDPVGNVVELHPTRVALIEAGERLFAERGLHGVSLREIGLAAGQRNNNVTQYHFGSKEGLVVAIFDFRSAGVNAERNRRLDRIEHPEPGARALLEAFFVPLAEEVAAGNSYVRFLARLRTDGHLALLRGRRNHEVATAYLRVGDLLCRGDLAKLPRRLYWNRWSLTIDLGISALANFELGVPAGTAETDGASSEAQPIGAGRGEGSPTALGLDEFVADLLAGLTAFILAPRADTGQIG